MVKELFIYLVKVFYSNQNYNIKFSKELFKCLNTENGLFDQFFDFINKLKKTEGTTYLVKRIGCNLRNKKRICDIIKSISVHEYCTLKDLEMCNEDQEKCEDILESSDKFVKEFSTIEANETNADTCLDILSNNVQSIYHIEVLKNNEISFKFIQNSVPYKIPVDSFDSDCNTTNLSQLDTTTNLLSSTKLSDIDISEDSTKIKEYSIIRNKIIIPKNPTQNVILSEINNEKTIDLNTNPLNTKSKKSVYKF
ncbi:hypothetical protein FF38_02989 [Lucilia cuprina]|uniref:Uncharacterized protein n=1 Tax=Lucilia cuprina TaxID=7375 RepID=A0A0L0CMV3_LUCCU|nr:hypothetical protein FF38_02989 [Lucilia cuprina]